MTHARTVPPFFFGGGGGDLNFVVALNSKFDLLDLEFDFALKLSFGMNVDLDLSFGPNVDLES